MPITRTPWTDDDGTGTTGTIVNNSEKTILYNQIDAALPETTITVSSTGGTIAALPIPSGVGDLIVYIHTTGTVTVQGITAGRFGQRLRVYASNSGVVEFVHMSASAVSANRLYNTITSGPTTIAANVGSVEYIYDGTIVPQWRLVAHQQGLWLTPPFNAANFSATGGGTFTVAAGNLTTYAYYISGSVVTIQLVMNGTIGGTPTGITSAAWPFKFSMNQQATAVSSGSTVGWGLVMVGISPATDVLTFQRLDFGPYPTGTVYFYVDASFAIS